MSLLFITFITSAALAAGSPFVGDLEALMFAKDNMDHHTQDPMVTEVANHLAGLGAASLAIENAQTSSAPWTASSGLNVRKAEVGAFKKPLDAALDTAFERAHIGKLSTEPAIPEAPTQQGYSLNVRKVEDAAKKPLDQALDKAFGRAHIGKGSMPEAPSGLNVRKIEDAAFKKPLDAALDTAFERAHIGELSAEPAIAEAPIQQAYSLNVRKLDDAVKKPLEQALDNAFGRARIGEGSMPEAPSAQVSRLNVRKIEDAPFKKPLDEALNSAFGRAHIGEVSSEPVLPEVPSGLNVRKQTWSPQSGFSEGEAPQNAHGNVQAQTVAEGADVVNLEAISHARESAQSTSDLLVPKQAPKEDAQMPSDGSKRTRFTLKPSNEMRASFSKHAFSTPEFSTQGQEIVDLVQRRAEVENIFHVTKASVTSEEVAAQLAEKREEVEDTFHLSKADNSNEPEVQGSAAGIVQGLLRFVLLLAAVASIASIAYQKIEVISQMYEGKQGLQKFKAKHEDLPGLPASRKASQMSHRIQVTTGVLTSALGSARQGLVRRGAVTTVSSSELGV